MNKDNKTLIDDVRVISEKMVKLGGEMRSAAMSADERICELQAEVERLRADNDHQRERRNAARDAIEKGKAERRAIEQERDQLKSALQRFMELNIHDRDLSDELWCIQQEEAPNDISLAQHDAEVIDRLKTEMMTYVAKLNMQPGVEFAVDFMDDKIDQLRQQAKEPQS